MAGKRTAGEGTIAKRKNGTFEGAVYVLMTNGGKKRIHVYGKTAQEVQEKLTAAKMRSLQGVPTADRSWTLGEYMDYWLEHVAQGSRRRSTCQQYIWVVERFIKPGLGSYRLEKLSVAVVQKWLDTVYAEGASRHRVRLLRTVLSTVLTRAQREELVQRNVAHLVELPRYQAKERVPWSAGEAKRFLAAIVGDENRPPFLLLMMYGLRRGEVLGLRWGDVDFEHGVIRIRNQLQRVGGELIQGPVKTNAGNRDLPILANVRQMLLNLQATPMAVQRDLSDEALVFVTELGGPRDPDGFSKSFQRAAKRQGLRVIRMHDIRHTTATLLKDLGVSAKDAQLILGHSDITTTQQIYQHGTLESSEAALIKIESALLPQNDQVQEEESQEVLACCRKDVVNDDVEGVPNNVLGMLVTSVNDWYARRDLNPRPLVPEAKFLSLPERLKGVGRAVDARRKHWLIGAVVVSCVVRVQQLLAGQQAAALLLSAARESAALEVDLGKTGLFAYGVEYAASRAVSLL